MKTNHHLGHPVEPTTQAESMRGLQALALTAEDCNALARQGFVAAESRGPHGPFYKLRFRLRGRQVTRYLGKDPDIARQVQREVWELQTEHRLVKEIHRLTIEARQVLRQTKLDLQQVVEVAGFAFHGLAIRKPFNQSCEPDPGGANKSS